MYLPVISCSRPAITAISLGLVGHSGPPERLGRNQRLASIGGLAVAALMGLTAFFSFRTRRYSRLVVACELPQSGPVYFLW
jgi:hypothetical protein